jgi:hypothetical protein
MICARERGHLRADNVKKGLYVSAKRLLICRIGLCEPYVRPVGLLVSGAGPWGVGLWAEQEPKKPSCVGKAGLEH